MNKKIGIYSSVINVISVIGFALSMLIGTNFGSYFSSMFISFSFMPMMCAFCFFASEDVKLSGYIAIGFAVMYATIISLVYFAQLTTVHTGGLTEQAYNILTFGQFGLFFNYDMLGYSLMALATFFAGLTIKIESKADKWLKALLLIHGLFFLSCFFIPMVGLFTPDMNAAWIGTAILEFWCAYFIPVGILSSLYFLNKSDQKICAKH